MQGVNDNPFLNKMNSNKRSLILKVKEGVSAKSSTGVIDARLFNGNNALYAICGPGNNLWHLEYAHGAIPASLQQKFTSFPLLLKTVQQYLDKRNIEVEKVQDIWDV